MSEQELAMFRAHCEEMLKLGATSVSAFGQSATFAPRPHTLMLNLPKLDDPDARPTRKLTEDEQRELDEEEYVP